MDSYIEYWFEFVCFIISDTSWTLQVLKPYHVDIVIDFKTTKLIPISFRKVMIYPEFHSLIDEKTLQTIFDKGRTWFLHNLSDPFRIESWKLVSEDGKETLLIEEIPSNKTIDPCSLMFIPCVRKGNPYITYTEFWNTCLKEVFLYLQNWTHCMERLCFLFSAKEEVIEWINRLQKVGFRDWRFESNFIQHVQQVHSKQIPRFTLNDLEIHDGNIVLEFLFRILASCLSKIRE